MLEALFAKFYRIDIVDHREVRQDEWQYVIEAYPRSGGPAVSVHGRDLVMLLSDLDLLSEPVELLVKD
jgi:hypothetical protein